MQTQLPAKPQGESKGPKRKFLAFTRKQLLALIIIGTTLAITVVIILSTINVIPAFLAAIISTVAGLLGTVFTLWSQVFSADTTQSTNVLLPPVNTIPYRGLAGIVPPVNPATIQQREKIVKNIYELLLQDNINCVVLTGIAGAGKSTVAALVYHFAEKQRLAGQNLFAAQPLWLTIDQSVTMTDLAGNIFEMLGKPWPKFGNLSPHNQATMLFNVLKTVNKGRLIILDQFENLLDWQKGEAIPSSPGIGEWLDALNSEKLGEGGCRIILTSRTRPRGTYDYTPTYMHEYEIKELEMAEGMALLQQQGVKASEADLRAAVTHCNGHAFALTHLAALLRRNRSLSLHTLLNNPFYARFWSGDIARNLLDYIYTQQLDDLQRQIVLALSVYREAVPLEATQEFISLSPHPQEIQILSACEVLLAQHLLQAAGEGRYQLHAIVVSYALDHFDERDASANQQAMQSAHEKAAHYYIRRAATSLPAREKRRRSYDIHDLIEAIWHKCQACHWPEAYELMQREVIFADLRRWGENALLLALYDLLLPLDKWHPEPAQAAYIYNHLGRLYDDLGRKEEACAAYEEVLSISRQIGDGKREGVALNNLGRLYKMLGKLSESQTYFEQALDICRVVKDRGGEATTLNNLGSLAITLGKMQEAQEYLEQALSIFRSDMKYPAGEARALNGLGRISAATGQKEQAQIYYQQSLSLYQGMGDRRGESQALNNLGNILFALGQQEEARTYLEQALPIRKELGNRWAEAETLKDLGQVSHALGKPEEAWQYYRQALTIFREEKDRSNEGQTLLNIGVLSCEQGANETALACVLLVRNLRTSIPDADNSQSESLLQKLREKVEEDAFALLLARVEPQVSQIVEQALSEEVAFRRL